MEALGFSFSMWGQSCSCSCQSSTSARRMASARFSEEMSQPGGREGTELLRVPHARLRGLSRAPPTIKDDVVGVHHGQQVPEGHINITGGAGAQADGGGLEQGAVVVGFLGWRAQGPAISLGEGGGLQHPQNGGLWLQTTSTAAESRPRCRTWLGVGAAELRLTVAAAHPPSAPSWSSRTSPACWPAPPPSPWCRCSPPSPPASRRGEGPAAPSGR